MKSTSMAWGVLALLGSGVLTQSTLRAADVVNDELIVLNDNGAWCWYEDERAIISEGRLLVGSVADSSGAGGAERDGNIEISTYDFHTGEITRFVLHPNFSADDHNSPAILVRPDGRYLALYAKHGGDQFTRYRISSFPHDPTEWEPEQTFANGAGTTYSNLYRLSAENGGAGRLYNFNRSVGFNPNAIISDDDGQTWTYGGRLLAWPRPTGDPKYTGSDGGRPYLRYQGNGVDEIHFITTEDHPRAYDNSIYHGVVRGGKVYDSFGNIVDDELFDGVAKKPNEYTPVFNTDTSPLGFAWTTDLRLDEQGHPYALFTARADNNNVNDHRFLYARFTGTTWDVHEIAKAGGYLYNPENDYTGLGTLDPRNPDVLYISTEVDPRNDSSLAHYEIFKGVTADGGATWTWTPITENSTMDNLRPILPPSDGPEQALVWYRGTYTTFTNYNVEVVMLPLATGGITFVDAVANTDGTNGNTTLDGALIDFTPGTGNATTSEGIQSVPQSTDSLWHHRGRPSVNGGAVWETDTSSDEQTAPLRTTLTLEPGSYYLYGLFWNNLSNAGAWDVDFRVGNTGAFTTFNKSNATLASAHGREFTSPVITRDGAQWLLVAPLGRFDITSSVDIHVNGSLLPGEDRTWFEGVGYEPAPPACALIPAVTVGAIIPVGATSVTVNDILPEAEGVNVYLDGTTLVGSVAGSPPNTPPTLSVSVSTLAFNDRISARQIVDNEESCGSSPAVRVGNCAGVPSVSIQADLVAGRRAVTVIGVHPSATSVCVYIDGVLAGTAAASGADAVQVSVSRLLAGQTLAATQTILGVEGCVPSTGVRVPFRLTYIDAVANTNGDDGNTTANGALINFTAGTGNTTTTVGDGQGPTTDNKWYLRPRPLTNSNTVWEAGAAEIPPVLITTITLPPATYDLRGVFWNNLSNTGTWDIQFRVGAVGDFVTFDKANATLSAADGSDFVNAQPVSTRDGGQWLLIAPLGQFRLTGPTEIHISAVDRAMGGDERSWYDGIGFQRVCSDPFADADDDGDVDMEDFGALQRCITGPDPIEPLPDACQCLDYDKDNAIDGGEIDEFAGCMSGPAVLADPACDD